MATAELRGSFGVVTREWSDKYGMEVAKKSIRTSSPAAVLNELQVLICLGGDEGSKHHVIQLLEASRTKEDGVVLVFPSIKFVPFRELVRNFSEEHTHFYMRSILSALQFVHSKGIVHRDIKPANFLYDAKQKRGWLIDYGLAEQQDAWKSFALAPAAKRGRQPLRQVPPRSGTPGFKAPETLWGSMCQTSAVDVFSAGIIFASLIFRRYPFLHSKSCRDDILALQMMCVLFSTSRVKSAASNNHKTMHL